MMGLSSLIILLGVVIWEIIEIKTPYNEILSNEEVANNVVKGTLRLPKPTRIEYPSVLYDSMVLCWNENPSERPTLVVSKKKDKLQVNLII